MPLDTGPHGSQPPIELSASSMNLSDPLLKSFSPVDRTTASGSEFHNFLIRRTFACLQSAD